MMKRTDFEISIGEEKLIDRQDFVQEQILQYRYVFSLEMQQGKMTYPLTYSEFSDFNGWRQGQGKNNSSELDEILSMEDWEIELRYKMPAATIREERKKFLTSESIKKTRNMEILLNPYFRLNSNAQKYDLYKNYLNDLIRREYLNSLHDDRKNSLPFKDFFSSRSLPISSRDLKAHAYIAARSGHGKSELIKTMLHGLLHANQGAILFDPHGDIAEQVVRWKEFADDPSRLIYFSPYLAGANLQIVPVINPLAPLHKATDLDSAVENFIGVVSAVVGGDFDMSVRMKMLLRPCLYTLAMCPESTVYDLIDFMAESPIGEDKKPQATPWVDKARALLTNRAQQDILRTFFDRSYDTTKAAIRDRLRTFLASHGLDRCLAGESTIDLAQAMNTGKFIVFNLSRGKIGNETSSIFGRFLLAAIQNAAMQRQEQKAEDRRPVFTFIDEADRLLSDSVMDIYKETRKYGLHLAIAQQITGFGMSGEMKRAVFGNSNVRIAGAGGGDVETTRDLATLTGVDKAEIESLPAHVFYAKRGAAEAVRFTVPSTLADGKNAMSADEWEQVKAYQLSRYYRHQDEPQGASTYSKGAPVGENKPPIAFN